MISACETEDGVVFDMSELEADALRSYADGLVADPKHPFVELLRSQGLVVGDTPVPHLAVLLEAFSQATKVLTAWVVAPAGCRRATFFVGPHSAVVSRCDEGDCTRARMTCCRCGLSTPRSCARPFSN